MPLDLRSDDDVALLCAVMAPGAAAVEAALADLAAAFGPVTLRGPLFAFDMTDYYEAEMGPGLCKGLAWFGEPVAPASLAARKEATLAFERARAVDGRRTVNVDPGLVSAGSLVLATTKASGHRVCLAPGIWAEVTLLYEKGAYRPLPWTYRDFRRADVGDFLLAIRRRLRRPTGGVP